MRATDIIVIVLDTQRADRLGCYGYERPISPNLDRFADGAIVFEQAVSPAQWTIPAHASLFSGLYPSTHQVLQSSHGLSPGHPHIAELLSEAGYETIGFCNNPLVGILDNGFKRGFKTFYNYGGAVPSVPGSSTRLPRPLGNLAEAYTQALRRLSYPVQNFFGRSDLAFQLSLNAWMTPLWSKMANFKGQNERSVRDIVSFLRHREREQPDKPLFLFINLMETHLPFWPPGQYVDQVAPYFRDSKEARTIMRTWNREAFRWAAPLAEPHGELEHRVLNDMYDAEVAYQDDYLGPLLDTIHQHTRSRDTLTIIVADHGDGLGDHGYMGHAFVAYEELVHVPLIVNWPSVWPQPARVDTPVSTRRIFHTVLEAAGDPIRRLDPEIHKESQQLTLVKTVQGNDPENAAALSEVYPPHNFVRAIERRQPALLKQFNCLDERHAIVRQGENGTHKLIHQDDQPRELFDLPNDPLELQNKITQEPEITELLSLQLVAKVDEARKRRDVSGMKKLDLGSDAQLLQRLRGLGYLD